MKHANLILLLAIAVLQGCYQEPMSEKGFRLPDGDADKGRKAFVYMQCHQCHEIAGEELPAIPLAEPPYVTLGGPVTEIKTYGELVTAIIHPSHDLADGYAAEVVSEDGESHMYNYNGFMTVQELTDIVTFLQPHYQVIAPDYKYRPHP